MKIEEAKVVVVAVMRNELVMLEHFLSHYRELGVEGFLIADNCSEDGTREFLLCQPDVALYSTDTEYRESHFGVAWQQAMLANHCLGKWVLIVDADEFLVYPEHRVKPITQLVNSLEADGFDCAGTWLVDMYPKGKLADCDFERSRPFDVACYHDAPPVQPVTGSGAFSNTARSVTSRLRHRLAPNSQASLFMANKYPLLRYAPWIRLSEGIHYTGNVRISPQHLTLCHFKYHSGFATKIEAEIRRKQHFGGAIEYQKYRTMMIEACGSLYQEGISCAFDFSR